MNFSPDNLLAEWLTDDGQMTDATATDAYFEAAYHAPIPFSQIPVTTPQLPSNCRLLTRSYNMVADVPQMLLPADPDRLRVAITPALTYDTLLYKNLYLDPRMSSLTSLGPFADVGSSSYAKIIDPVFGPSIRVTNDSPCTVLALTNTAPYQIPVTEGLTYSVKVSGLFEGVSAQNARVTMLWYNAGGPPSFSQSASAPKVVNDGDRITLTRTAVAPPTAVNLALQINLGNVIPANSAITFSQPIVTNTLTPTSYFNGYSSVNSRWDGTVDNSPSSLYSPSAIASGYRIASDKTDLNGAPIVIGNWENNYHTGAVWAVAPADCILNLNVTTR